jgi:hypothetical protein
MEELLGGTNSKVNFSPNPPTVIMLIRSARLTAKQQQQENLQTSLENKGKSRY